MAVTKRPYYVVHNGVEHMVEASQPAAAAQHVVGQSITELRPARASEILAWSRAGKPIAVAGAKAEITTGGLAPQGEKVGFDLAGYDTTDAASWLADQMSDGPASSTGPVSGAWQRIISNQRMTLEEFDIIRTEVPLFGEAIGDHGAAAPAANIDQVRASLEENPMSLTDVVHAIGMASSLEIDASARNEQARASE